VGPWHVIHPRDALRVTVAHTPGVDTLALVGDLDLNTVALMRDVVFDPTRCVQPLMVLDLCEVDFLDSQGIAAIVSARRHLETRGGELAVVCMSPHLLKLLRISRLDTLLRVVASADLLHDDSVEGDGAQTA
jgi:anti-sigma B factor antagonist